jgi:predicted kinase
MYKVLTFLFLFIATSAHSQFGGVRTVIDTQRVVNKFSVFKLSEGQRLVAPKALIDSIGYNIELIGPLASIDSLNATDIVLTNLFSANAEIGIITNTTSISSPSADIENADINILTNETSMSSPSADIETAIIRTLDNDEVGATANILKAVITNSTTTGSNTTNDTIANARITTLTNITSMSSPSADIENADINVLTNETSMSSPSADIETAIIRTLDNDEVGATANILKATITNSTTTGSNTTNDTIANARITTLTNITSMSSPSADIENADINVLTNETSMSSPSADIENADINVLTNETSMSSPSADIETAIIRTLDNDEVGATANILKAVITNSTTTGSNTTNDTITNARITTLTNVTSMSSPSADIENADINILTNETSMSSPSADIENADINVLTNETSMSSPSADIETAIIRTLDNDEAGATANILKAVITNSTTTGSKTTNDTITNLNVETKLVTPNTNGSLNGTACSNKGEIITDTADNRLYFCNGSTWNVIAYDYDKDGLTDFLDQNDNVDFTAGSAVATDVLSGKTFYTGSGMIETTGSIPTYNGSISNGGSISSGSYTPANFPFTLQTDDDYVDKDLIINNPTNLAATNIKNGITIAGVTGTFMNGSTNGLADLYVAPGQPDSGVGRLENIYANQVPEFWGFYDRFGTLRLGQMPKFYGPMYSGASNLGLSSIDNDKYRNGNYVPNFSSGSYTIDTRFIPVTYSVSGYTDTSTYNRGSLVEHDIILKKDPNLVGSNVLNTVSIFGVSGSIPTYDIFNQGGDFNSSSGVQVAAGGSFLLPFHFNTAGTYVTTDLTVNALTGADQTIAGVNQILDGYDAYAANGSVIDGNIATYDINTQGGDYGSSSGANISMGGSNTLPFHFNTAGTYVATDLTVNTLTGANETIAGSSQILEGYDAYAANASVIDGNIATWGTNDNDTGAGSAGTVATYQSGTSTFHLNTNDKYVDGEITITGDADLAAGNIKSGVDILGVAGDYPSGSYPLPGSTALSDISSGVVLDDYEGWTETGVRVEGNIATASAAEKEFTEGEILMFNISNGQTVDYSTSILSGKYVSGSVTVKRDSDLTQSNIKSGVSIYGIPGSLTNGIFEGTPTTATQAVTTSLAQDQMVELYATLNGSKTGTSKYIGCASCVQTYTVTNNETGNSTTTDNEVLVGEIYYQRSGNNFTKASGSMPNKLNTSFTPSTSTQPIAEGYYNGGGTVAAVNTTITMTDNGQSANYQTNITLSSGNMTTVTGTGAYSNSNTYKVGCASCNSEIHTIIGSGDVGNIDGDVKNGVGYWRKSGNTFEKAGGTMTDRGATSFTPSASQQQINEGYYNGAGYVEGDADFTAANIRSGTQIWGVTGTLSPEGHVINGTFDSTVGTGDVRSGKRYYTRSGGTFTQTDGTMGDASLSGPDQSASHGTTLTLNSGNPQGAIWANISAGYSGGFSVRCNP